MGNKKIVAGAIAQGVGMIHQGVQGHVNHGRQKELMGIQQQNQMKLNEQGSQLQKKMWDETNYGAQMKHIKDAGLNASLMYGMSGGGGTTAGSQGGGQAQSGSVTNAPYMGMEALLLDKQLEVMDSQANKNNADAEKTKGVDTSKVVTEIENIKADTQNIQTRTALMGLEAKEKAISIAKDIMTFEAEVEKTREDWRAIRLDNDIKDASKDELIRSAILENAEKISEIELNEKKSWNLGESMYQLERDITSKISERARKLEIGEDKLTIDMFKAEIDKWKATINNDMDKLNLEERKKERIWNAGTKVIGSIAGLLNKGKPQMGIKQGNNRGANQQRSPY